MKASQSDLFKPLGNKVSNLLPRLCQLGWIFNAGRIHIGTMCSSRNKYGFKGGLISESFSLCTFPQKKCVKSLPSSTFQPPVKKLRIKVNKSQKQFFLKLHCPKTKEILDKILSQLHRSEFCLIFRSFFGQWSSKKNCF